MDAAGKPGRPLEWLLRWTPGPLPAAASFHFQGRAQQWVTPSPRVCCLNPNLRHTEQVVWAIQNHGGKLICPVLDPPVARPAPSDPEGSLTLQRIQLHLYFPSTHAPISLIHKSEPKLNSADKNFGIIL